MPSQCRKQNVPRDSKSEAQKTYLDWSEEIDPGLKFQVPRPEVFSLSSSLLKQTNKQTKTNKTNKCQTNLTLLWYNFEIGKYGQK